MSAAGDGAVSPVLRLRRQHRAGTCVVEVAFTEVGLDLSEREGSDRDALAGALTAVRRETGRRVARMHQVHGGEVAVLDEAPEVPPRVDAIVTQREDLVLMTRAADCVPVLLAGVGPRARTGAGGGAVGAAHAGRGGVLAGVVARAAASVRERGAGPVVAWVGPHVCGACYEVPEAMRAEVAAAVPATWSETRWGTPGLDLGAGVVAQLRGAGCEVVEVGGCTMEDSTLPSHRRDGAGAARFAGLVWMTAGPEREQTSEAEV